MNTWPTPDELRAAFGPRWAICRDTEKNRSRYGRCVSRKQYERATAKALQERAAHAR